ncbi:MAG: cadherin repeat domain-containing protein [Bacteroidota bacterium]
MKKFTVLSIALLLFLMGAKAQNVNIPDANFKAILVGNTAINTDGDDEISITEAQNATSITVPTSNSVSNLTGLELFINLTRLDLVNIQVDGVIDLKSNNKLENVRIFGATQLDEVNVDGLTSLDRLEVGTTSVKRIELSTNTALTFLDLRSNSSLKSLDLSSNSSLTEILLTNSDLDFINLQNGNNNAIVLFNAGIGSTCIQVDDPATIPSGWTKAAAATYSADCSAPTLVDIPNFVFIERLLALGFDTDGDHYISEAEAVARTGSLSLVKAGGGLNGQNIGDFTGIEAFTNLTAIDFRFNSFPEIDLRNNTSLTNINLQSCNGLRTINVQGIPINQITDFSFGGSATVACVQVDDEAAAWMRFLSLANSDWFKDTPDYFTADCSNPFTLSANTIDENAPSGTVIGTFDAVDVDRQTGSSYSVLSSSLTNAFSIQGRNLVSNRVFDFEATPTIEVTIQLRDSRGFELSNSFTIVVNDVQEVPVNFPDATFRSYVFSPSFGIDGNNDGVITTVEAAAFTGIFNIDQLNIFDLTGIEAFVNLPNLFISRNGNRITSVDLSQNVGLEQVALNGTGITTLDLSNNPNLTLVNVALSDRLLELNIQNGNNAILGTLNANVDALRCVQIDDINAINSSWMIGANAGYTEASSCDEFFNAPTDISLDNSSIQEASTGNIGMLSTTDPDPYLYFGRD